MSEFGAGVEGTENLAASTVEKPWNLTKHPALSALAAPRRTGDAEQVAGATVGALANPVRELRAGNAWRRHVQPHHARIAMITRPRAARDASGELMGLRRVAGLDRCEVRELHL